MSFFLIAVGSILVLGLLAALTSAGGKDEPIVQGEDCSTCSSLKDGSCKIACLMDEKKRLKNNKKQDTSVSK